MKFKRLVVEFTNKERELFEECEWNESAYGVFISPKMGEYVFYPFHNVFKVQAFTDRYL